MNQNLKEQGEKMFADALLEMLLDLYNCTIKGMHKHTYEPIDDLVDRQVTRGEMISIQSTRTSRHQCTGCGKIVMMTAEEVRQIPYENLYARLEDQVSGVER